MSGLLAVFARRGSPPALPLDRMLQRMAARGTRSAVRRSGAATLAIARAAWDPAADAPVRCERGVAVIADAALYYRAELRRKVAAAGVPMAGGASVAQLILAAYRAWGTGCVEHLEGDFAFVLHDEIAGRVVCARDFAGRKPLFFADLPDALVVASTAGAILDHPDCPDTLDLATVAAAAAGLFASRTETAYTHIASIPPGHTLVRESGSARLARHWSPPAIEPRESIAGTSLEEGAHRLRELLQRAVAERLDEQRPTAVWMSGGWDSTAVFGAGMAAFPPADGTKHRVFPVSIRYPPGDPGHEDAYIRSVAERWQAPVHWLRIADIPLLDRPEQRAAARDEPFGHVFELWNRSLARESRRAGARVALDGVGGDQLFHLSYVYLSQLLIRGRLLRLARDWRRVGMRGGRSFLRWAVLPELPAPLRPLLARIAGPELARSYLDRPVPAWMNPAFLARYGVLERETRHTPARHGLSAAAYETHWYLTHPFAGKILSSVASFALSEGVELRSPLYDRRIIEFAAGRPWSERTTGSETKRLLRLAARAWLPADVLAPRPVHTGQTSGYLAESLRHKHADFMARTLDAPVLAQLGMVDADTLRRNLVAYRRRGGENLGVNLFFTLQAELWLRSRLTLRR